MDWREVVNLKRRKRAAVIKEREALAKDRKKRRCQRRCFWIWPWGHVYMDRDDRKPMQPMECAACGKEFSPVIDL